MPRITKHSWWCGACKSPTPIPADVRECPNCQYNKFERHAQIHSQDRAVVYYNPATGEHRTPARADVPMPENYAAQGFQRHEIMSMTQWEKDSGSIHEATNFNPGNEPSPERHPTPSISAELKHELVKDMADAIASGPWTGTEVLGE